MFEILLLIYSFLLLNSFYSTTHQIETSQNKKCSNASESKRCKSSRNLQITVANIEGETGVPNTREQRGFE